jgi:hypothetical protein
LVTTLEFAAKILKEIRYSYVYISTRSNDIYGLYN